jgi:Zinc knuckle
MADFTHWLGQPALNAPRTAAATTALVAGVRKEDRAALTPMEKSKLKKIAQEGLEFKFKLFAPLDGSGVDDVEQMKKIYSVTMRVGELKSAFMEYDLQDVFRIASSYVENPMTRDDEPDPNAEAIDLFTKHAEVSLETVKQASLFFSRYGQDFQVENLFWSGTKILNSCDDELRAKIEEQTIGYEAGHCTGPVYFKIMMNLVQASSKSSLRALTRKMEQLSVKDFDGESVVKFCSVMRGAVELLSNNNALPSDAIEIVGQGLKNSSTAEFNEFISLLLHNHEIGTKALTIETLLSMAEGKYSDLWSKGSWESGTGPKSQDSSFFAGECFNCGKKGHMARDCKAPKKEGHVQGGYGKRGGRSGRGGRGGRSGGRGRGRGSKGRGGGLEGAEKGEKGEVPPKPGESRTKTIDGKVVHWCGRCQKWCDHSTEQHRQMAAKAEEGKDSESKESGNRSLNKNQSLSNFSGFVGAGNF